MKRSQGMPRQIINPEEATSTDDVASVMKGNFRLEKGILSLAGLNFAIPGTEVQLAGTYALGPETLDLHGKVKLQAKLSQTTTGVKSLLLKVIQPLVQKKKQKGSTVEVKVAGTYHDPSFTVLPMPPK